VFRGGAPASGNASITGGSITGVTGAPYVLSQSFTAVNGPADTNENVLATISVPAGALATHGAIRLYFSFGVTSSANAKTFRIRFSGAAGTVLASFSPINATNGRFDFTMANAGATGAQVSNGYGSTTAGTQFFSSTAATVDSTAATTLIISIQKATAGETVTLNGYIAELVKP
jgi:hypothetical protein